MKCQPEEKDGKWTCVVCGFTHDKQFHKKCKSAGLGDSIARVTNALGIKKCGGCAERQKKFNELLPYKSNEDRMLGRRGYRENNKKADGA